MATCAQCQAPVEPYTHAPRPQHPEWCRRCRGRDCRQRYRKTEKGRAAEARYHRRYQQTEKYRVKELRYRTSEKYRVRVAAYWRSAEGTALSRSNALRYARSEQGRVQKRLWMKTAQGRANNCRNASRRRVRDGGGTPVESVDRHVILDLDGGMCHLCDRPVDAQRFHIDHLIPIAVEPIEAAFNCAVSHPVCNIRKHARFGEAILAPAARARWAARRPEHLAELDAHVARILAARSQAA